MIRVASLDDAAAMNRVYNPFIEKTAVTFETSPLTLRDRRAWIEERQRDPRHPVFVACAADGAVVGFANAGSFDPRGAYETSVKVSVFLAPEARGRGFGPRLYKALFEALSSADVHRAYALIVAPNPGSARLHESFGFRHVATLSEVGRKFGRYHDVMWFEKRM